MKNLQRIFLVLTLVMLCEVNYIQSVAVSDEVWHKYKAEYNKKYATAAEESNARYNFAYNSDLIDNHNNLAYTGRYGYWLWINQFTDMHFVTFNELFPPTTQPTVTNASPLPTLPTNVPISNAFDPRVNVGVRPNVENQGVSCNSGWAYAAKGAIELWDAMQFGAAIPDPLSAQQLIDCAGITKGCINQVPQAAYDYLTKYNMDLQTRWEYPNNNASSTPQACIAKPTIDGIKLLKYSDQIADGDDETLRRLISNRYPVVIEFNPTSFEFMHYSSGLFVQPSTSRGSHYMIVIGYDETAWIIQNSFGTEWGDGGYLRLSRSDINAKLPKSATLPTE